MFVSARQRKTNKTAIGILYRIPVVTVVHVCILRAVTSLLDCSETSQVLRALDLASSFTTARRAVEDKGLNHDLGHLPVSAPVLRVYQRRAATELEHEVSPHLGDVSRGRRLTGSCFPARLGSPSSEAQSQRSRTLFARILRPRPRVRPAAPLR